MLKPIAQPGTVRQIEYQLIHYMTGASADDWASKGVPNSILLTKPFAPDEMVARIEVLLRRQRATDRETVLRIGDLELDLIARSAHRGAHNLELLPIEFRLLEFLVRNSGQVLTRTMIFEAVWGYHFDPGTNVIDVHIGRLRKKVDPPGLVPLIRTVRGSGYQLAESE